LRPVRGWKLGNPERTVRHEGHRAVDRHAGDIHRRLAVHDPLRDQRADTAGEQDPERVQTARGEEPAQFGRLAQQRPVVGREALGAAEELADPCIVQ
jgi:hypothetical protein